MRFLRSKRGLVGLGVLGALVAVTLLAVLPGFAATTTGFNGQTSAGGTGPHYVASGGSNTCAVLTAAGANVGTDQYFATNPKAISGKQQTLTASNGMQAKLTVTVDKTYTFLNFTLSGGIVTDVGIKGGNGTDWYSYDNPSPPGGVTHDEGLTAPGQTTNGSPPFYGLSQTVFCWTPKITCQPGVAISDPQHPGETVELPNCTGKDTVYFDFSATTNQPAGDNVVSVYAHGGSGTPTTPMVEHIAGTFTGSTAPTLQYSDLDPAGPLHDMRLCQVDPRAGGADPLALAAAYQSIDAKSSVLPAADPANDPEDSSCLITSRTWVDAAGVEHFEAYVYTDIDGQRGF